jgi:hypothetical protein
MDILNPKRAEDVLGFPRSCGERSSSVVVYPRRRGECARKVVKFAQGNVHPFEMVWAMADCDEWDFVISGWESSVITKGRCPLLS